MSQARKIISNTFSQVFAKAITALLAVVVVKILSNYLNKSGYGDYGTIYEFLAFFGAVADMGIFTIAVREMSHCSEQEKKKIFGITITLRTLLTTIAMLAGAIAAFLIPKYTGTYIPRGVAIAAIATWLVILSGTVSTILQVSLKMQFQALGLVLGKVITVIFVLLVTQVWYPVATEHAFYLLIWAGVIGSLLTFVITAYFANKISPVRFLFDKSEARKLLKEAIPFGLALILNTIYFRLDIVLFSLILPRSVNGVCMEQFCADTEAGSYVVAVRMLEVLIIVPLFFMNSVLPVLTRHIRQKSERTKDTLNYSFYFLFAAGLAGAVGIFVLARPIVRLISSDAFLTQGNVYGSDTALKFLMIAMFFTYLTSFFGFVLIAFGHQKKLLWINLFAVLFNLFSNLWVIPVYGLRGAATTSAISEGMILILSFFVIRKITNQFSPDWKSLLKMTFSAVMMGIAVYFTQNFFTNLIGANFSLLISIAIGMAVFIVLLFATKAVNKDMLQALKKNDIKNLDQNSLSL